MSYNESLSPHSNYPLMSQSQWNAAPFNEVRIPEREFEVTISQTLSRTATITTDDYQPEYDEEDGNTYANTENTDWQKAYENSDFKIQDLLGELKGYVQSDLAMTGSNTGKGRYLQRLLNACDGWVEDDYVVSKD